MQTQMPHCRQLAAGKWQQAHKAGLALYAQLQLAVLLAGASIGFFLASLQYLQVCCCVLILLLPVCRDEGL